MIVDVHRHIIVEQMTSAGVPADWRPVIRRDGARYLLSFRGRDVTSVTGEFTDVDTMLGQAASTGVDHLLTVADVWRELPMDKRITMQWWLEPSSAVPRDADERVEWLYSWWARIDGWIAENRPVELPWHPLARR